MSRDRSTAAPAPGLVLLAAGGSTRMGIPKQLLLFRGRGLLRRTAEEAVASGCRPVVAVLGAHAPRLADELADLSVRVVANAEWEAGMGTSIRAGIRALEEEPGAVEAAILAVCDQPFVSARLFRRLAAARERSGRRIVAAAYAGILGVPALFHRSLFPELLALAGSEGARRVIEAHADEVVSLPFSLGAVDIDTPEEYARLITARASTRLAAADLPTILSPLPGAQ